MGEKQGGRGSSLGEVIREAVDNRLRMAQTNYKLQIAQTTLSMQYVVDTIGQSSFWCRPTNTFWQFHCA